MQSSTYNINDCNGKTILLYAKRSVIQTLNVNYVHFDVHWLGYFYLILGRCWDRVHPIFLHDYHADEKPTSTIAVSIRNEP